MTDIEFSQIFSDAKLRNAIVFAHKSYDSGMKFIGFVALGGLDRYLVTSEQIEKAKQFYEEAKRQTFEQHKNDLIFCGMGCDYDAQYDDDVCNHRIWTQFENSKGKHYLLEFQHTNDYNLYLSAFCDFDAEEEYNNQWEALRVQRDEYRPRDDRWKEINKEMQELGLKFAFNSHPLMKERLEFKYTQTNILLLVNREFDCNFNNIVIDLYNIHPSDKKIFCYSPTRKLMKITELTLF